MKGEVVPIMRPKSAEATIRALALNSARIIITDHAQARMEERDFTLTDLTRVLQFGSVINNPRRTPQGDWSCKVVMRLRGSRDAGVVTVIAKGDRLIIITMEWEDVR